MQLPPYDVYREHLLPLFYGHPLWDPDPAGGYAQVRIGDVGYITRGIFIRMFNVLLEWDDPLNHEFCPPDHYHPLNLGPFINIRQSRFSRGEYYSRGVTPIQGRVNPYATTPEEHISPTTYRCRNQHGALLVVPHDGINEDVIRTKVFEEYIRDHVVTWFALAQRRDLGVRRLEDLILVTGCTLVTSWGVAAFVDRAAVAEISLRTRPLNNGGATFDWRMIHSGVVFQSSRQDSAIPRQNQCIFIRGLRGKRTFFRIRLRAAAEPLPDDPDNSPGDETDVKTKQVEDVPTYRDPVIGVLDYIAEKCPNNIVAIAHDDDLRIIKEAGTLNYADMVEGFLHQHKTRVLVKGGAATVHERKEPKVSDETKAIFYVDTGLTGESIPFILHPVLSKYLKPDIPIQPLDYDHYEDLTSPAAHPPVPLLKLENHRGYPQHIIVWSSNCSPGIGVTVQDVLRTIHEDMGRPSYRHD